MAAILSRLLFTDGKVEKISGVVAGVKGDAPFQVSNNLKDFGITCYTRLTTGEKGRTIVCNLV